MITEVIDMNTRKELQKLRMSYIGTKSYKQAQIISRSNSVDIFIKFVSLFVDVFLFGYVILLIDSRVDPENAFEFFYGDNVGFVTVIVMLLIFAKCSWMSYCFLDGNN